MTKKTVVTIAALTLILSLFFGCKDNLIERLEKVQAWVEISVKLPEEFKTTDPTDSNYFDPDTFEFTLTWYPTDDSTQKTENKFVYAENLAIVYKFDPGEYTFVLEGKVTDESTSTEEVKAYGEATTSIKPGQREQLAIPIKYYIYGDEGGFEVAKNGDIVLSGKITVPAGTVLSRNVKAEGDLTVEGNLEINGNFSVQGNLTMTGDLSVKDELTVGGILRVPGAKTTTINGPATVGSMEITEDATINGDLTITDTLTVNSGKIFTVTGNLSLKEDTNIVGNLVTNGDLSAEGDLIVGGNLTIGNDLDLDGTLTVTGIKTITGSIIKDSLEITEDTTFDGNLKVTGALTVASGATLTVEGGLTLKEDTEIEGNLNVKGGLSTDDDLAVNGTITVTGNTSIGGDLHASSLGLGNTSTNTVAGSFFLGTATPLEVTIGTGSTLTVERTGVGYDTVEVTGGGTLVVTGNTTLEEIKLDNNSTLSFTGTVIVDKITRSETADTSGTVRVDGSIIIGNAGLEIGTGTTLDISNGQLDVGGEVLLNGTLQLGADGWTADDLGPNGIVISEGSTAGASEIKKGTTQIKWYTLHGAKAHYFIQNEVVQIRFLEGTGEKRVTPRTTSITPTEPIVRVGNGALFEVTDYNKLQLNAKELILEAGSTTKIKENRWIGDPPFNFTNGGTITVNTGAEVIYGTSNSIWIGGTTGEWKLAGSAQMKYDGSTTTVTKNTDPVVADDDALLEINDWKNNPSPRALTHTMIIAEDAKVLISMGTFTVDTGGTIEVRDGGKLEIKNGSTLTAIKNREQLKIKGDVVVNNGATINLDDTTGKEINSFYFDSATTGRVFLNSGGSYKVSGKAYFAPPTVTSRRDLSFNTDKVDLVFSPALTEEPTELKLKKYTITGANNDSGIFTVNQTGTVTLINHYITVGKDATFSFVPTPVNLSDNTKITVESGGTLEVPSGKTLSVGTSKLYVKTGLGTVNEEGTITGTINYY